MGLLPDWLELRLPGFAVSQQPDSGIAEWQVNASSSLQVRLDEGEDQFRALVSGPYAAPGRLAGVQ